MEANVVSCLQLRDIQEALCCFSFLSRDVIWTLWSEVCTWILYFGNLADCSSSAWQWAVGMQVSSWWTVTPVSLSLGPETCQWQEHSANAREICSVEMFVLSLEEATTFFMEACRAESHGQFAACRERGAVHARLEWRQIWALVTSRYTPVFIGNMSANDFCDYPGVLGP